MANEEHLKLLQQGVEIWNRWRKENPVITPDLTEADLTQTNMWHADLHEADLRGAKLVRARLAGANLAGANLAGANLSDTRLWGVDLRNANLYAADLRDSQLYAAELCGANLREVNLRKADLRKADLHEADLREADLSKAHLHNADLSGANLYASNLREARLVDANLSGADLREADLREVELTKTNLCATDLRGVNLVGNNLRGVNLVRTNLRGMNLVGFDLSQANLNEATLIEANLSEAQVLGTNFEKSILTAACLQDWNINSTTNFNGAICEYIYLKPNQQERRPREGTFNPGEFAALFQQALDTVDLIFTEGIDWQAFFQSFQDLQNQYADQDLSIQAIEKKRDNAFIVRLEVPDDIDKAAVEEKAKTLYGEQLKQIEGHYQQLLHLQGQQLDDYREQVQERKQENSKLLGIVETLAEKESASKYDLRGAQIAGGVADSVQGDQVGGAINNEASEVAETHSLAEVAAEIQHLLKQLKAFNPAATEADQTAFLNASIPPARRERFISALQSSGSSDNTNTALKDVPYAPILKALVAGWQRPN